MNKVEICGVNTAKLPNLSKAKKDELLREIKAGNSTQDTPSASVRIFLAGEIIILMFLQTEQETASKMKK